MSDQIKHATGLLIIEVVNSNPNGDPDRESDPRQRPDERGQISPVSFKRKLRDLVERKDAPVWKSVKTQFKPELADPEFSILESRDTKLKEIREVNEEQFMKKYWDGRVFGNTELEKGRKVPIKTGVVQYGLGISISPVRIERMTTTNPAVQEDKSRGMAPLAYRVVEHGVYVMPFFINPTAAVKSGCTARDIELMKWLIPYAYPHTASYIRPAVEIRHAWYVEHKSALGSCSDFALVAALTPRKKDKPDEPSTKWEDYEVPTKLPDDLVAKVASVKDLMKDYVL